MTVFALSRYTVIVRNAEPFAAQLMGYFVCEAAGHDPNQPCDRDDFRQLTYPILSAISLVLIGLFPAVNLVYALNVQELKEKCGSCFGEQKRNFESTTTFSTSRTNL